MNSMFDRFMDMVQELQAIEQKEVDNSSNWSYTININ
jgi:hypothetical protein